MNRLGFAADEMGKLRDILTANSFIKVQSVFSHLASSEDPGQDDFTLKQFDRFKKAVAIIKEKLNYPFLEHIANSAAIFPASSIAIGYGKIGNRFVWC